jgi:mannitol operon transcriptional antiterminator
MVELTNRQNEILAWLCCQERFISVTSLASHFGVSSRSIRNDLDAVKHFAAEHGVSVDQKRGYGIGICVNSLNKERLLTLVSSSIPVVLTRRERQLLESGVLLINRLTTYQDLADICRVSRQTIVNDFFETEKCLQQCSVSVEKIQGVGIRAVGKESDIRHAFIQLLANSECSTKLIAYFSGIKPLSTFSDTSERIVSACENVLGFKFQDTEYIKTIVEFVLMRISIRQFVSSNISSDYNNALNLHALDAALVPYIDQPFERKYLSSIILSQRLGIVLSKSERRETDAIEEEAEAISQKLVNSLRAYQDFDDESIRDIITMLTTHLRAAIYRSRNDIQLHDESLISYVKVAIPIIYEFTARELAHIAKPFGITFDEGEVTYISMYIASISEMAGHSDTIPKVLFICSFGLATSSLLKARMTQMLFGCELIGPMSLEQAEDYLSGNKVDLIISTCEFRKATVPVVVVNPMVSQNDIDVIKSYVNQLPYTKMCSQFLERYSTQKTKNEIVHHVSDYVLPGDMNIIDNCGSWEQAIRIASQPLVFQGLIDHRYVDAMINAVHEFGVYMVLTPETAFVHAGINDGITCDCASVLVCRNALTFGSQNSKRIHSIVVLGIKNREKTDLINLASIFGRPENIVALKNPEIDIKTISNMHS